MKYLVEQRTERTGGKFKTYWVVVCPDGSIANGYRHTTSEAAKRHSENCNAHCLPKEAKK